MMIASAQALFDALRTTRVLDRAVVDELARARAGKADDVFSVSHWLVQTGRLTRYQIDQVMLGQGEKLVLGEGPAYRLLEPLGEGGMGQVFKASQHQLGRLVAIKLIRPQLLDTGEEVLQRFRREALAAAQLSHPNIVTIYDYATAGGVPFLVMEFVDGIDLSRLVRRHGPLPVRDACDYIRQAAMGLQHAADHGMVHRDIKPSNLLVTYQNSVAGKSSARIASLLRRPGPAEPATAPPRPGPGAVVKVLDMGLARFGRPADGEAVVESRTTMMTLTQEGVMIGSPDFIAPEQARNPSGVDIRADLYSLGCTFYYLLSGQPPFPNGTPVEKILSHQLDRPTPLESFRADMPYAVRDVISRLMAKDRDERYRCPSDLVADLAALEQSAATPVPTSRPTVEAPAQPAPVAETPSPTQVIRVVPQPQAPSEVPTQPGLIGTRTARPAVALQGHTGVVLGLSFSPDNRMLASSGVDGVVRVWDLRESPPCDFASLRGAYGEVTSIALPPDRGDLVFAAGYDGKLRRWDWTPPGGEEPSLLASESYRTRITVFSPDGRLMATAGEGKSVILWNVNGPEIRRRAVLKEHQSGVDAVAFAPDNRRLASGGEEGTIRLWEVGRFWCSQRGILFGHNGPVLSLAYAASGEFLASGGMDCTVRIWPANGDESARKVSFKDLNGAVRAVQFLGNPGLLLALAGSQVTVWDIPKQSKVSEWRLEGAVPYCVAVSPDGRRVAVGGSDGTISLYELGSNDVAKKGAVGWINNATAAPPTKESGRS
jgi:serine/threonine-protein kinase